MLVKPSTRVGRMTTQYPELEEILGWHGIEPESDELRLTLEEICEAYEVDIEDVLVDIAEVMDEDEDEDEDDSEDEDEDEDEDDNDWEEEGIESEVIDDEPSDEEEDEEEEEDEDADEW